MGGFIGHPWSRGVSRGVLGCVKSEFYSDTLFDLHKIHFSHSPISYGSPVMG
jgi:hypothetical protein